jgi:hypothetical protein
MNIQSEAGLMNKHEEILSKYENEHELTWSGQKLYPKAVILKAMRELEESLAARTEGDGWIKVEDGLPELDESVNIAYWIQPAKGNGFWVVEVGYLQAITKRKTADGEKEYGEWKHGDQWNSSTPQYWARYRPLPSPPKTT